MCWSPNVTLAFVIGECFVALVLCTRDEASRRFVVFVEPLILQEVLQWLLWREIESDEASAQLSSIPTCSPRNSWLSLTEMVVVLLLPTFWCWRARQSVGRHLTAVEQAMSGDRAQLAVDGEEEEEAAGRIDHWLPRFEARGAHEQRHLDGCVAIAGAFGMGGIAYATSFYSVGWWEPFCTTRGTRGGHQLWPWLQPALPTFASRLASESTRWLDTLCGGWVGRAAAWVGAPSAVELLQLHVSAGLALCYMMLLGVSLHLYRAETALGADATDKLVGWLPQHALMVLGPAFVVPLYLAYGFEAGSVWCWQASVTLALALLEPFVIRHSPLAVQMATGPKHLLPILHASTRLAPRPRDDDGFEAALTWQGARPDKVFKAGRRGVGYYTDAAPEPLDAWNVEVTARPLLGGWPLAWRKARHVRESVPDADEHLALRMRYL